MTGRLGAARGAGLYLHIPFCSAVCPYCDFSVAVAGPERRERFVACLISEIERHAQLETQFDTIYLGGGTPSLLAPDQLDRILGAAREQLRVDSNAFITMEANPEDVTRDAVQAWRGLGVSMVSLGVQSFRPESLRFLGRRHDPEQARFAVEEVRQGGFRTVSLDLIYGLPGQTLKDWNYDLGVARSLMPDHLSCYQLTMHSGTTFARLRASGRLAELPADEQAGLFFAAHRTLDEAGIPGYEVSNFARSADHRSPHNQKYWTSSAYLGLGPSAHSFDGERRRWWNQRETEAWLQCLDSGRDPVETAEDLDDAARALEMLMLGLRTRDGVDLAEIRARCGIDLATRNGTLIAELDSEGCLVATDDRLTPTLAGWALADSLALRFEI